MRIDSQRIRIHYLRPPDREQVFEQELVVRLGEDEDRAIVTLLRHADVPAAKTIDGRTVLEPGAPIVWFTFAGRDYDIGRFHLKDGTFTGYYANILTPVEGVDGNIWRTTDLFLDVWVPAADAGAIRVLDEDELTAALTEGWLPQELAEHARRQADDLVERSARGDWPPAAVRQWTLERARRRLDG